MEMFGEQKIIQTKINGNETACKFNEKFVENKMLLLTLIIAGIQASAGLKILSVFPFPQKSHHIMINTLLKELIHRGHDVTVYSGHRIKTNLSNYKHYYINTSMDTSLDECTFETMKQYIETEPIFSPVAVQPFCENLSEETLSLPQIKDLLTSNETFDVVLLETFFAQEALVGFGHRFSAPVITISTFIPHSLLDSLMGNPNPLAYLTSFQLPYNSHLTFFQRVKTVLKYLSEQFYSYYVHIPLQQSILEKHFKDICKTPLPSLIDMLTNVAVVLMNIQPEVTYPRAFVPNMISVGGLHIPSQRTTLPQNIQKFMDESNHGVIYFSLGSTFSGSSMPEYIQEAFISSFEQIPERILWKIDKEPPNLPPNIMTVQWAPQTDILAHPKCKAFLTHGGLLSLLEATYFAVPLIGIPLFADQGWNMAKVEQTQIGIALKISTLSHFSVSSGLEEILHNPVYKKNMDQLSAQMRDRLVSPLNTAVYWVEYVAKHQGAQHLRSPARTMPFFQYFLIDVILFLLSVLAIILICTYIFLVKSYRIINGFVLEISKHNKSKES